MEAKDKKYSQGIEKSLASFDAVEEWADYIAFLSKLLKSLQQTHKTKHWIPHDLKISITLSKCLLPSLPSGVHQKTLEVYNYIFMELGIEKLSEDVNIWIPGILPIMQFASISIKPIIIDLYRNYLLTLPSSTLKNLVKPVLSYLLLSIDDERSEFFEASLSLVDGLQRKLDDDSLFWQSIFLIMIMSEERRLGCLVWCNKRFPNLNVLIESKEDIEPTLEYFQNELQNTLNSDQLAVITPEPGLLVRAFNHCLKSPNLLIQRGFFDLIIKNLQLNSTILQKITSESDLEDLLISALGCILKKDMSINRRIWTWFLGPETTTELHLNYFQINGSRLLSNGLLKLINAKYDQSPDHEQKISSFKMSLALMDRWEIGSEIIPKILVPFLKSIENSIRKKSYLYEEIFKSGEMLFDAIETITIYSQIFELIQNDELEFVNFILSNFNVNDEEMIIHQFPLLFITTLIKGSKENDQWIKLLELLDNLIPRRSYLPIEHADEDILKLENGEILAKIAKYYLQKEELPFKPAELSVITLELVSKLLIDNIKSDYLPQYVTLLNNTIDSIPNLSFTNDALIEILQKYEFNDSILQIAKIYPKLKFSSPFIKLEVLKKIIIQLSKLLQINGDRYQVEIVKTYQSLTLAVSPYYVEAAISSYLLSLANFSDRLQFFNYLWIHSTDSMLLDRPLNILLDELNSSNVGSTLRKWIIDNINKINKLFNLITFRLALNIGDSKLFTYNISLIYKVLQISPKILAEFNTQLIEGITFKEFTTGQLKKFLEKEQYDPQTLAVIFQMFEVLLNGKESSFEDHVTSCFFLTNDFINNYEDHEDYESVAIVLFDHLSQITKLLINKHSKVSHILIERKDDTQSYPFIIDFLISSFEKFNKPDLLNQWITLLTVSLKFQDEYIFEYIEPIIFRILNKIQTLYSLEYKNDVAISLLLSISEEVLSLFRTYVITIEINDDKSDKNDPGFFSSVVSGVIPEALRRTDSNSNNEDFNSRNRSVLIESFQKAISISFEIWESSDKILKLSGDSSSKYQSLKLKARSKSLLETLFKLEPIETVKVLINLKKDATNPQIILKLLHVLDGSRPQLTIPNIFKLILNNLKTSKSLEISSFLIDYTLSLEDDSMEDIYNASINFLKDLSSDFNSSKSVLLNVLKFLSIFSEKLSHSKFGDDKKIKREIYDYFSKILPITLNSFKNLDSNLINTNEEEITADERDAIYSNEEIYNSIKFISSKLEFIIHDIDKQITTVSTISNNLLIPVLKSKKFPNNISSYHLDLLDSLISKYNQSKNLKLLVNDIFNEPSFFNIKIEEIGQWNIIINKWIKDDSNEGINEWLSKLTQSSSTNLFNWNENEQLVKISILRRCSYLILIGSKDQYIVILKELFKKIDELGKQDLILSEIFFILRIILLKFSSIHLYDYWTFIYTLLQEYFFKILNKENLNLSTLLQACKLLDLLLILKFEEFQEWIFVIDTIDAIYRKNKSISLIDKINDEILTNELTEKSLLNKIDKGLKTPALLGITKIENINSLKSFFDGLSYYNYENVYNNSNVDFNSCEQDLYLDLFH
ncbi:hypothetical protein WICMUC_000751 [Wickerhamomyces mucosus]|uniref:Dopey N-terminal domain-containing protein n=1 Tax=Wickerhamomyces mucosus TaxID=1378264 RepID=A0A9P8PY39_9ASCO|nr:hypothetical protein WICMUC_000751 [Wickerhamomyces mucosus]